MTRTSLEERILQGMVEAARREPAPLIDSNQLQARLRQKWFAQQSKPSQPRFAPVRWFALAIATLMLVVGALTIYQRHAAAPDVAANATTPTGVDGDLLQTGSTLAAQGSPIPVVHAGRARWVLAPHTTARIVSLGPSLVVGLDEGRIDADVVPNKQSETFVVETRTHRVAVHGTQFSVTLEPSGVLVEVSSGVVVVSALADPSAERTRLTAPQKVRFPYTASVPAMPPAVAVTSPLAAGRISKGSARQPAMVAPSASQMSAAQPELPLAPSAIEQETALDFVRAAAARCFARQTTDAREPESNVVVHLETQLSINLAPAGNVLEVSFSPPVPQPIQSCTLREVQGWAVSPSRDGAKATRAIILTQ